VFSGPDGVPAPIQPTSGDAVGSVEDEVDGRAYEAHIGPVALDRPPGTIDGFAKLTGVSVAAVLLACGLSPHDHESGAIQFSWHALLKPGEIVAGLAGCVSIVAAVVVLVSTFAAAGTERAAAFIVTAAVVLLGVAATVLTVVGAAGAPVIAFLAGAAAVVTEELVRCKAHGSSRASAIAPAIRRITIGLAAVAALAALCGGVKLRHMENSAPAIAGVILVFAGMCRIVGDGLRGEHRATLPLVALLGGTVLAICAVAAGASSAGATDRFHVVQALRAVLPCGAAIAIAAAGVREWTTITDLEMLPAYSNGERQ